MLHFIDDGLANVFFQTVHPTIRNNLTVFPPLQKYNKIHLK